MLTIWPAGGFSPDDIDVVINSHLHYDHCGWNTVLRGGKIVPTFPKAKSCPRRRMAARTPSTRARRHQLHFGELRSADQKRPDGVTAGRPGNRPGNFGQSFPRPHRAHASRDHRERRSDGLLISDLIPTSAHIDLTWVTAFDLLPLQTIESRKRYYAQSIPEKWLTMFTHDPNTPWASRRKGMKEEKW